MCARKHFNAQWLVLQVNLVRVTGSTAGYTIKRTRTATSHLLGCELTVQALSPMVMGSIHAAMPITTIFLYLLKIGAVLLIPLQAAAAPCVYRMWCEETNFAIAYQSAAIRCGVWYALYGILATRQGSGRSALFLWLWWWA